MLKTSKILTSFLLILAISLMSIGSTVFAENDNDWITIESKPTTDVNKKWTVSLSAEVDASSVNTKNVYIKDEEGAIIPTMTNVVDDRIEVYPISPYESGKSYTIFLESSIKSKKDKTLTQKTKFTFDVLANTEEVPLTGDLGDGKSDNPDSLTIIIDPITKKFEALAKYKNATGKTEAEQYKKENQDPLFSEMGLVMVSVTEEEFLLLKESANFKYIEKNIGFDGSQSTDLGSLGSMIETKSGDLASWGYDTTGMLGAEDKGLTGKGIKIAVMDTGVSDHGDLAIIGGKSTVDYTTSYADDDGHGTHVAGIISAKRDGKGLVGVAPDAELYSVKVLDEKGRGNIGHLALGVFWAIGNDIDIINISIGYDYDSPILHDMIKEAVNAGIPVITGSSNSGTVNGNKDTIKFPGKYAETITVGAVNENSERPHYSGTGSTLDFVAPGDRIVSTSNQGDYIAKSGTSMATPYVTGMIALLKEAYPNLSAEEYKTMLREHAIDLGPKGFDTEYGYGLVSFESLFPTELPEEELTEEDWAAIRLAEQFVENSEKYGSIYFRERATTLVNELKESSEKERLLERVNHLQDHAIKPEEKPEGKLEEAERYVGYAETYGVDEFKEVAVKLVTELLDSDEKKVLISRLQALGLMMDESVDPEPELPEEELTEEDWAAIRLAERFVMNSEKYGSTFFRETATRLVNELKESSEKERLLERVKDLEDYATKPEEKPELSDEEKLEKAEQFVGYAEKYAGDSYKEMAVELVTELPNSKEKMALITRLQALGLMMDAPPVILINPNDLNTAKDFVGYAEKYVGDSFKEMAINYVLILPASFERDELIARMHKIELMKDIPLSGLEEWRSSIDSSIEITPPVNDEIDHSNGFEYAMANRYVLNAEKYGSNYYYNLAVEHTLALPASLVRNKLIVRLHKLGLALDTPLYK